MAETRPLNDLDSGVTSAPSALRLPLAEAEIVVFTSILGRYDTLKEPSVVTPGCRYLCLTDEPFVSQTWEIVRLPPGWADPRRESRRYKLLPHLFFRAAYSLWIDGAIRINIDVRALIDEYLADRDFALYANEDRDCVYDEAEMVIREGYDRAENVLPQVRRYRAEGLPEHHGLIAGGVLLRRHTPAVARLNEAWWAELERGSVRDQVSFNYCAWRLGFRYATFRGLYKQNDEFQWLDHRVERYRSEFDEAEWNALPIPSSVCSIPADLMNTALEYSGIYQDGWLAATAFFGVGQTDARPILVVRGLLPLIDDPAYTTDLLIVVDGSAAARATLSLGEFEIRVSDLPGRGRRRVELRFSRIQQLPAPDWRMAAALLRFVGFEAADALTP